jgi:endonuclease-3
MNDNDIHEIVEKLRKEYKKFKTPIVTQYADVKKSPFHVLISCVLSLRTKDETTAKASKRLFSVADTPNQILSLSREKIEELIYPVGFYHTKAENLLKISRDLIDKYKSKVPDTIDELLTLKGVGRKTANLVVTLGFNKKGICVDTHVHRIMNRLGYISTKTPEKTEYALRDKLPEKYWIEINDLLVAYGQNICKPISPFCSKCVIYDYCDRIGVEKSR